MILDDTASHITSIMDEYLQNRWMNGYSALAKIFEVLPTVTSQNNVALLDLTTGVMLRIMTDMHNISHGRLGSNG